jgi:hypothetical protein
MELLVNSREGNISEALPDPSWYMLRAQLSTKPGVSNPDSTRGPSTSLCKNNEII